MSGHGTVPFIKTLICRKIATFASNEGRPERIASLNEIAIQL